MEKIHSQLPTHGKPVAVIALIPARYESTRFPGKPLAPLWDRTVIEWTYRHAVACPDIDQAIVATDDPRIAKCVEAFGGEVIMTSSKCRSGTDRLAEALHSPSSSGISLQSADLIVNIQGDWPVIPPQVVSQVIEAAQAPNASIGTAAIPLQEKEQLMNPSVVKCTLSCTGRALYFSRSPIPDPRSFHKKNIPPNDSPTHYAHLGLYAYTPEYIMRYASLPSTALELAEGLEQLRALEHGDAIQIAVVDAKLLSVDTPSDLEYLESLPCNQNTYL